MKIRSTSRPASGEEHRSAVNAQVAAQRKQSDAATMPDSRAASLAQLRHQERASNSSQAAQLKARADLMAGRGAEAPVQRVEDEELLQGKFAVAQREEDEELLQGKFAPVQRMDEEEPLQGKFEALPGKEADLPAQGRFEQTPAAAATVASPVLRAEKPNDTGLPNQFKSGIESLSGMSMDHVKVHYNSARPAQLQAHAYAQGSEIHVAPGQERHLPHEAWHVVQQARGRVKPTVQMKGGVPVNDDAGLEHEADMMGARALATAQLAGRESTGILTRPSISPTSDSLSTQRAPDASTLQLKLLPRASIATDLALLPAERSALFTQETLDVYGGPRQLVSGQWETQLEYANSLMAIALEADPRISYKLMGGTQFFSSANAPQLVAHLRRVRDDPETMFLLKGGLIGVAAKTDSSEIHPRLFGGMPDVDLAGTIVMNGLGFIPGKRSEERNVKEMSDKEVRKALMGLEGGVTFTNDSGHFKFDAIPDASKKTLTKLVKSARELTEDVTVDFSAQR